MIAVEDGTVTWWTTSARAGCMLYLHGTSGTTYLYIHLNNDRTLRNDNRGGCTGTTTYTAPDGAEVRAGEQIAWSGDSGDADGNPHLHFELHPNDGDAVSPFAALNAATHTLFPARTGARAAVGLRGIARAATATSLDLEVTAVRWWPGGRWVEIPARAVQVGVDTTTRVDAALIGTLDSLAGGATVPETAVTVFTRTAVVTPGAIAAEPLALSAARVRALA